ncbi:hypothetical protein TNCV_4786931 [Trichonephila clavipes]|nr:hypothetical protein TNCV_4786931 [Trichonephila clavipes]
MFGKNLSVHKALGETKNSVFQEKKILSQATCVQLDNGKDIKSSYRGKLPLWPTDPLYYCPDFCYSPEHNKRGCHSLVSTE